MAKKESRKDTQSQGGSVAKKGAGNVAGHKATPARIATSAEVARRGIKTGKDFADLMSCLMADVIEGSISPSTATAACAAGSRLLKVVELQIKYGKDSNGEKVLRLSSAE